MAINRGRRWALICLAAAFPVPAVAAMICDVPPYTAQSEVARIAELLTDPLTDFPTLQSTLTGTLTELCVSDTLRDARGYFDPDARRIVLATGLPDGLLQAVMVHELRHAEQYAQGLCPSLSLGMKDYAQAVFAMEADASVTSLVVAAHQREARDSAMWDALRNWPMQGDIAATFEASLARGGNVTQAAHDAFDAWFTNNERTETYYISSCLDYLDQTERDHLLPQYDRVAPEFLNRLCLLPDGTPYPCAVPDL